MGNIEGAMTFPPEFGRAQVRGDFIRRHAPLGDQRFTWDWDQIQDHKSHRVLDLSDPFQTEEKWVVRVEA